jgi:hypothetical protein
MRRVVIPLIAIFQIGTSAYATDSSMPDPRLTPGSVATSDKIIICRPDYSKSVRHTSSRLKQEVYRVYGIDKNSGHYEIDHLVPLSIGGADTGDNLWPESRDTRPWNAHLKDKLESYLHVKVCSGQIAIKDAQEAMAKNWIAAYGKYLGVQ